MSLLYDNWYRQQHFYSVGRRKIVCEKCKNRKFKYSIIICKEGVLNFVDIEQCWKTCEWTWALDINRSLIKQGFIRTSHHGNGKLFIVRRHSVCNHKLCTIRACHSKRAPKHTSKTPFHQRTATSFRSTSEK